VSATSTWRDRLRGLVFDNFWLKLFSLVVSLGFYAFIHGAESVQRTVEVDVVRLPPPADRQLLTELPTRVAVILRGPRTQIEALRRDDLGAVQIDLRSGRGSRIELDPSSLRMPTGVVLDQMYPAFVEARWDDVVQKDVQILVARSGDPAPGLMVKGAVLVEPSHLSVRGPRSILNVMQLVRTAPFEMSGLPLGVHQQELALDRPPSLDNGQSSVKYGIDTVLATVEIGRALAEREVPRLKVQVVGVVHASVQPATVTLKLRGTADDLKAIDPELIVVRVEPKAAGLDTSKPGNAYLDVLAELPKVTVEVVPSKVYVQW